MRGLALEGGGARGAYQIGVVKAYLENGYEFDGYVGTSIGAINAAVLAQGDFDVALRIWMNISAEQIFDADEQHILRLINRSELKIDAKLPSNVTKAIAKIIGGRGMDTSKMKALLEQYIDEEKIRKRGKDFGLVTISINERRPYELMLEDIPQGSLVSYIMASAALPWFHLETIDENTFLDGGLYNNCPVNLLQERGYDEIIAVRTNAIGIFRKIEDTSKVKVISPSENLGSSFVFTQKNAEASIKIGYFDGLRAIKNLRGTWYYVEPGKPYDFFMMLASLSDDAIHEIGKILGVPVMPAKRMLFEHIIPKLGAYLKLKKGFDYADFVIGLLERLARQHGIDRYQVYGYDEFRRLVGRVYTPERGKAILEMIPGNGLLTRKRVASELFIEHLMTNAQKYEREVIA